ncbi:MAG: hypothetical protein Q4Q53_05385 [Methanocorpusculum sp.]|nr:hypothetical protein [Methanocorpusculum sp.]
MKLEYERDLSSMKLVSLKGTAQDEAVLILAKRLGISRQAMRKILIEKCDLMTIENLPKRIIAAESDKSDELAYELSLPHLTTAAGILNSASAEKFLVEANEKIKQGEQKSAVIKETINKILEEIK